jgi:hypothetical protein
MSAVTLNRIGLSLGMVGVVMLFIWGPPQPSLEGGVGLGLEEGTRLPDGRTVTQYNRDVASRRRTHTVLSRIGLALVGVGFLCQLWATWK